VREIDEGQFLTTDDADARRSFAAGERQEVFLPLFLLTVAKDSDGYRQYPE
jgi:hypothetical protein